jgi:outer membrane protein assembly factor BamB
MSHAAHRSLVLPVGTLLAALFTSTAMFADRLAPVLFLHGIQSSADTWEEYGAWLISQGWSFGGCPRADVGLVGVQDVCGNGLQPGRFYRLEFSNNDDLTLLDQAKEIALVVDVVLELNSGAEKVILVGHSMGGLAGRSYLQHLSGGTKVQALVSVGTPHLGAELATFCTVVGCDVLSIGAQELQPDSPSLLELNDLIHNPLPGSVLYTSIIGIGMDTGGLDGDGVVSAYSQNLASVAHPPGLRLRTRSLLVEPRLSCSFLFQFSHTCETTDQEVWQAVRAELSMLFWDGLEGGTPEHWRAAVGWPEHPWPMEQHDPQRTGRAVATGPQVDSVGTIYTFTEGASLYGPIVIASNGCIFFVARVGSSGNRAKLVALNDDGEFLWSSLVHDGASYGLTLGESSLIYFGARSAGQYGGLPGVTAYDSSGEVVWNKDLGSRYFTAGPHLAMEGSIIYGNASDPTWDSEGFAFALNSDGTERWLMNSGFTFRPEAGVTPLTVSQNSIFITTSTSYLKPIVINRFSKEGVAGGELFRGYGSQRGVSADQNDVAYLSDQLRLHAIGPDAVRDWYRDEGACDSCGSSFPALSSSHIVTTYRAADATSASVVATHYDGSPAWTFDVGAGKQPLQPLVDSAGNVYVAVNANPPELLALSSSGIELWRHVFVGAGSIQRPLAMDGDGRLYAAVGYGAPVRLEVVRFSESKP